MQSIETYIKLAFTLAATAITTIFGGWDMALQVLLIAITIDYATGLAKAFCSKELSSEIGAKGIIKKVMILCIVVLAAQLDRLMGTQTQLIRTVVIYYYVANEGLSILENLSVVGIPFPPVIKEKLLQIKGEQKESVEQ